jgi:hypothetical protein
MAFVPEQAAIQEFAAARLHSPLHNGVHPRHPDTGEHRLDVDLGEDFLHQSGELSVSVSDQKACPAVRILEVHHKIPDRLDHPAGGRVSGGAPHAYAPAGVLDDGQDVLTPPVQGDGFNEIASQ